jgi:hypothetical protein
MSRMREEMYRLRQTVVSLVPEPYRNVIQPPYDFTQEQSRIWLNIAAIEVVKLTETNADGKAPCPLCGEVSNYVGSTGFTYPDGLIRHLTGSHNARHCPVMYAADGLRRVRHRELYPNDYGPYGCD